ncbi:hypothetical protein HY312_03445 [Candidatus Saccharibacteria bacterium]|nr:hypothetical protein [Candidatus Saccharibacteria bacterium]
MNYTRHLFRVLSGFLVLTIVFTSTSPSAVYAIATPEKQSFRGNNEVYYYEKTGCEAGGDSGTGNGGTVGSGDGGGCGTNKNADKANEDQIWNFLTGKFKQKGYSDEEAVKAAAGVMGNWQQESAFNSYRTDGQGCAGGDTTHGVNAWGLAQWCGGRVTNLKTFAADKNTGWDCLGTQLEFFWHEMETQYGTKGGLFEKMKGKSPGQASDLFDEIFEGSEGSGARAAKAEAYYKTRTGQAPADTTVSNPTTTAPSSDTTSDDTSSTSCAAKPTGEVATAVPTGECADLVSEVKRLRDEGKFQSINGTANLDKDLENCTEGPIDCGTGSGKGGVTPQLLRAFIAVVRHVDSKGLGKVDIASMNTGHSCDGKMHPQGKAVDFWNCYGLDGDAKCRAIFTYIADNAAQLGVKQVIHDAPPSGYTCGQKNILCLADHNNEIHMGL